MLPLHEERTVRVCGAEGAAWEEARAGAAAVVHDGGLTEIARGSETVLVLTQRL